MIEFMHDGNIIPRPRPPLPLSATLTEEEAATIIQAHYRGYCVRCTNPHVVEFRKWQRRLMEEKMAVLKIQKWWRNVMSSESYSGKGECNT